MSEAADIRTNDPLQPRGWRAVGDALAEIAENIAVLGESVRDALLPWVRGAENLARLLVYLLAREIVAPPLKARGRVRTVARRPHGCSFRFAPAVGGKGGRRGASVRRRRGHSPRVHDIWDNWAFRDREREALEKAARAAAWAARRRPPRPPPKPAAPPRPLGERLAALARVLADPEKHARRCARRLTSSLVERVLSPRRAVCRAPFSLTLLEVHDRAWRLHRESG